MSVYKGQQLVAGTPDISGKANTDMNNLNSTGKNIGNWTTNMSNCITKIPQDIKLELDSGTLTLKAGSKLYVPNGFEQDGTTPKFDVVTISNDVVVSSTWTGPAEVPLIYRADSNELNFADVLRFSSGSTAPTQTNVRYWYDTTNNVIKRYQGGSMTSDKWSFPLALLYKESSSEDTIIKSIDQVFNGFGYIGSTVFSLPGVECLKADGLNPDGTMKSIKFTVQNVGTRTLSGETGANGTLLFTENGGFSRTGMYHYYRNTNNASYAGVPCVKYSMDNGTVTEWHPMQVASICCNNDLSYQMDGAFTYVNTEIANGTSINGSTALEYTLSSLPNDGYCYECLLTATITTDSTSGHQNLLGVYSSLFPADSYVTFCRAQTRTSSSVVAGGCSPVPIGTDRKLYVRRTTSNYGTFQLYLMCYRRIGTNR